MKKTIICLFIILIAVAAALPAQQSTGSGGLAAGIGASVMVPAGDFTDVTGPAFGNSIETRWSGLFPHAELRLKAAYYYCSSPCNITTSYQAVSAAVSGGYPFFLNERIHLTPLVGLGVLCHVTEDIFYEDPKGYADPFLTAGAGLDVYVLENLSLNALPEYTLFFEQDCCGVFFSFNLGVIYYL